MGLLILSSPMRATAQQSGDFKYTVNSNAVTITGYASDGGAISIPSAISPPPDFNGIRLGDPLAKHQPKFETSPPDSDLSGYKGSTYYYTLYPRTFAGVSFDMVGAGVRSGLIEHLYFWLRTRESEVPAFRKAATDSLNQHYARSGISPTRDRMGRNYASVRGSPPVRK